MAGKKGGAYIASGSYACTFSPPLQCQGSTSVSGIDSTRKVGKVFNHKKDGATEIETQRVLDSIDPEHLFTVNYYGKCRVGKITTADDIDSCDKTIQSNENLQIVYGHGGKDLWSVIGSTSFARMNDVFVRLFFKFQPVIEGMKRLNTAGYLHMDIKPDNIVFDGSKLSMIDFGLMSRKNALFGKDKKAQLAFDYPYYPPEFKLHSGMRTIESDLHKFQSFFMQNFGVISVKEESVIAKELQRFLAMYASDIETSLDGARIFDKSDVYSLGVTLTILHKYMITNDDARTYIIKCIINDMINCNPYERSTWDDVLRKITEIKTMLTRPASRKLPSSRRQGMDLPPPVHLDAYSFKTRGASRTVKM